MSQAIVSHLVKISKPHKRRILLIGALVLIFSIAIIMATIGTMAAITPFRVSSTSQNKINHPMEMFCKEDERCRNANVQVLKEKLLNFLKNTTGSHTISGTHTCASCSSSLGQDIIYNMTGKVPGVWSANLDPHPETLLRWPPRADEAISQCYNGSIITLQWYPCPPMTGESCSRSEYTKKFTTEKWSDLITDGGHLNTLWKIRLTSLVVPFLKKLEYAKVIVIWDPLLHTNIGSYWYSNVSSVNGSSRLYQLTRDYLTKQHNLQNILWKWTLYYTSDLAKTMEQFWPGNDYVDVASILLWKHAREPTVEMYQKMIQITNNKPMTLEWLHYVPTSDLFTRQPRWTWFTLADNQIQNPDYNNDTNVIRLFKSPLIMNRDEMDIHWENNFTFNERVTASSAYNASLRPENALDGNKTTRWTSESSDPQWLQVELHQIMDVKQVKIIWDALYARGYQVQYSEDGKLWYIAHEQYYGKGGEEIIEFPEPYIKTKFVKIFCFMGGNEYGYSLLELEVY